MTGGAAPVAAGTPAKVVALLGAESSGKTTLAGALTAALTERGLRVARVDEYLREFCDRRGRTPTQGEQAGIAAEQARRLAAAARAAPGGRAPNWVVADTTPLLTAVYSEWVFGDASLHASAAASHARQVQLTLLTALDLPWQADGLQRDGPQVRAPVDALLRRALAGAGIGYSVVAGQGPARLAAALAALTAWEAAQRLTSASAGETGSARRWRHRCARCGDPDCERQLLARSG